MQRLDIPDRKRIRAWCIAEYMHEADIHRVVCFTCGNAAIALRDLGLEVIAVGPDEELKTDRWWTPEHIRMVFPHAFDATSGHLPFPLMLRFAEQLKQSVGHLEMNEEYEVPTGIGETVMCLKLAYPGFVFSPVFNVGKGTEYDEANPLLKYLNL